MRSIDELIRGLSRLPGVGNKSASRIAYHLIQRDVRDNHLLGELISTIQDKIRLCDVCGSFTEGQICDVCQDPHRDHTLICVVEQPQDVFTIEASGVYNGYYHVLHGAISPLDGIGPDQLTIGQLIERITTGDFSEVILAMNPTEEGDTTAMYITHLLRSSRVTTSRLASGLPVGGDLEYTDKVTLARSLRGRIRMSDQ
ncbi:MAG: recombination mediator RecR [Spirochaetia bacterium]|nr:recombination mediator RecR [Spirochaetia bacterium]